MSEVEMRLREGVELNVTDVARIACALKSLAVYTSIACNHEDDPEDLQETVDDGLEAVQRLFGH